MTKNEILELIDKCPYWGEDLESQEMIKDLKKWFEFSIPSDWALLALKDSNDVTLETDEFVSRKEFNIEIDKLWARIRQINSITTFGYKPDNFTRDSA